MITNKPKQYSTQSSQSGFTIIESLMAIVVVGILMTAIAPVIALSVGTRVQARRVELATQAARSYVDGIRTGAVTAPSHTVTPSPQPNLFANVAAPTSSGSFTCTTSTATYPYCSNTSTSSTSTSSLYCYDLDTAGCSSTSSKDLVIQAFRTSNAQNYILGLRVYRADAFSDSNPLIKSDSGSKRMQATFTGGLGSRKAPLVEMTTEISTQSSTFRDFCTRLGGC